MFPQVGGPAATCVAAIVVDMNPFGVCTRSELRAEGIADSTIADRCRNGVYQRLLPGVYCLGRVTPLSRCAAIVAWLPEAVLSHRTAAWLRNMTDEEPTIFEATIPRSTHRGGPSWLKLYRRDLPPGSVDEAWGMPTTGRARTLFDCVAVLSESEAGLLIDKHIGRTVFADDVLAYCGDNGSKRVRRQLRDAALKAASEPERIFARAMAARNIFLQANHWVGPYCCDFVDELSRTIIEIDGREYHIEPQVFREDRRRQNSLVLDDWLVLRYAGQDVFELLDVCADEAAAVIRKRRHTRWRAS